MTFVYSGSGIFSISYPNISFRYDPILKKYQEYRRAENPINPDDYVIKQEWYFSKDNTKIPLFIFHKKGIELNGNNPTILYGYGGFGNIESPSYMRNNIPWIKRGGIFAIANIRGGGEFGDDWHKQGIKDKKQNSFDDFICAAEYLINKKYTNSNQLGIFGGSNGGLLVSAVGIQRPELFKAICSKVPLTDMVRFPKFGIASRWIHEYGNPEIKQDLFNILKWSPYHNVKKDIKYPDFLFTTAEKDTRVDPLHARKMVAMLQENSKENEVYLYTEKDAGHGSGKPVIKIVENQAMLLTFFSKRLGLII
jgi:prolyl oligopeptidase